MIAVLLAAVAAIVAVSGGFRAHAGGLRLAVTSPLPLLLWCIAIAVVRHLAAPQQPLYRELPHRIADLVAAAGDPRRGRRGHRHAADHARWSAISRCS